MSVISPVVTQIETLHGLAHQITWGPMVNGDTGGPVSLASSSDRSVHVFGTFGAGGSVSVQGSNELAVAPTSWINLTDQGGTAIAITAAAIKQLNEVTNWIRPNVTAGDGTTSLTVSLVVRRAS